MIYISGISNKYTYFFNREAFKQYTKKNEKIQNKIYVSCA